MDNILEKIARMERFSHFTIEQAPISIFWIDSSGHIRRVNETVSRRLGYSRKELTSMTIYQLNPDMESNNWPVLWEKIKNKMVVTYEIRQCTKRGQLIPTEMSVNYIDFEGEEFACAFAKDISKSKRMAQELKKAKEELEIQSEKALRNSEERFRRIYENTNDAIFLLDPAMDKIIDANPMACKMLGYTHEELLSLPMSAIHPDEMPRLREFTRTVYKNEKGWTDEFTCLTKSGDVLPSEISASLFEMDGQPCVIAMVRDITLRKKAEQLLKQTNEELEKRVQERTAQLSEANASLQAALSEVESLKNRLEAENVYLQEEIKIAHNFENIISRSKAFNYVLRQIEQVASTDATVLITGETGTGKELIARAIHSISLRKERPLVKVNCAALPANLIEAELFGHEKGAFTGALSRKTGRFELADGGTLFLDEIGDLPLELQAKLLRVLQEGEFERLGNPKTIKTDVRVIAATNRDLENLLASGKFREDLFYRLNVFPIKSPPLRERKEDISLLVKHFVMKYASKVGKNIEVIPQKIIDTLLEYHWPGNVRELENVIERAVIISRGNQLSMGDWLPRTADVSGNKHLSTLAEVQKAHIIEVLKSTGWRVSGERGAAKILGMKATTLEARMKKLGIQRMG